MEPLKILYEDAHLVICCKPVGVLSEDSESGRCMPQLLREYYLCLLYTSIDVYPFWRRLAVMEVELQREDQSFTVPRGLRAVSYTHLDVYKRQAADRLELHR